MARSPAILFLVLMLMFATVSVYAAPSIDISSPPASSVLMTHDVNVTGHAYGSDANFSQASKASFDTGTRNGTVVDKAGTVLLDRPVVEDFDDADLNTTLWSVSSAGGLTTKVSGKALRQSGTNSASGYWNGWSRATSTFTVPDIVSANLTSFTGSGGGYLAMVLLYQDDNNWIGAGLDVDPGAWGAGTWVVYSYVAGGFFYGTTAHKVTAGTHEYAVKYSGGTAYVYEDQSQLASKTMTLKSPKVRFACNTLSSGCTVDSTWDDVRTGYLAEGTYTSPVNDTRASYPVFKKATYDSTRPTGTSLAIEVRTGNASDLADASEWATVTNGQTSGLPSLGRYIQFRGRLSTTSNISTPVLKAVGLLYNKPATKVELSIDGGTTWSNVTGLADWYSVRQLPENGSDIRARVTDVAGDVGTARVRVDVDTTPPTASILINGGSGMTSNPSVSLTLVSIDRYTVPSMKVSERPDLGDVTWRNYQSTLGWTFSGADGNRTAYAMFKDKTGWTSVIVNATILLDTHPPVGSILINDGALYTNGTTVSLRLDATDLSGVDKMRVGEEPDLSDASWVPYEPSLDLAVAGGDGEKRVYAEFMDLLGQISSPVSDSIILDTAPPVGAIIIDGGATFTNRTLVHIDLEATDLTVVSGMCISQDPAFADAHWTAYASSVDLILDPGDGVRAVYALFRDPLGQISLPANDSIVLDTVPPVVALVIADGATFTNARLVTVNLRVTDASRAVSMQLSEVPWSAFVPIEQFTSSLSVLLSPGDGRKVLSARAWDEAGNMGPLGSASIILDTTPPLVELGLSGRAGYTPTRLLTVSLTVVEAGVVELMRLGEDSTLESALPVPFSSLTNLLLSEGDGPKTVYARLIDMAGNVGPVASASIVLDTVAPLMGLTINGGADYTNASVVSVALTLVEEFQVDHIEVGEDPTFATATRMPITSSMPWTLSPGDGTKVLFVRGVDAAGNVGPAASASIVLDMTAPAVLVVIDGGAPFTNLTEVSVQVIVADDNPTGACAIGEGPSLDGMRTEATGAHIKWTLSGGDGAKAIHVRVKDLAGNEQRDGSATIVLDTTPPGLVLGLDGGAVYALDPVVTASLEAVDESPVVEMVLAELTAIEGAQAIPFSPTANVTLSPGDGERTVCAKVRDAAGNWGAMATARIVLDTTLPTSSIMAVPPPTGGVMINVTWNGSDATSGIASYDVQYREDDDPWTDWSTSTSATGGLFQGARGHTYHFRVRAVDRAGNVAAYPEEPGSIAMARVPEQVQPLGGQAMAFLVIAIVIGAVIGGAYYRWKKRGST